MPNHCYQQVFIKGASDIVATLHSELVDHGRFCDAVIPMPLEIWGGKPITSNKYGFETNSPCWYEWRCNRWGTKWDVCEVEVVERLKYSDEDYAMSVAYFKFNCWTAWSPPIPVWDRLHKMGIEVHATYQDEGSIFEGEYHCGDRKEWEPEAEVDHG